MSKESLPQIPAPAIGDSAVMTIPALAGVAPIKLDITKTREAEVRLIEAKTVNPLTYADLEHTFNEAYRELRQHHATLGYHVATANKIIGQAKASALIDRYPEFMAGKPKNADNADMRQAFLMKDKEYLEALERLNMLTAFESHVDGRIKVMENVCRYMRKRMDLILRSGLSSADLYTTKGIKNE